MTPSVTQTHEPSGFTPQFIPSPTLVASRLIDGILLRWPLHWDPIGELCTSWMGGSATSSDRAERLITLANIVVTDLHPCGAWSVVLDVDDADEPVAILASDRRQTHEIPFRFSSRAVRIGDRVVPLALNDAGRRVLEAVAQEIGHALGERPAPTPTQERRKGRRQ